MKKKYIIVLVLLVLMTQVPILAYNYYFKYVEDKPIECNYVLVSVGWMIVVLYIIHFVLDYFKNNSDE
ncbi:hypothetical protein [Catenibacterium mitsuokai]|uniref:hypothetical protein n=1 Tax=Catenibacterium mitsuokai TaxID=100886 RepID=UPI002E785E46|nr:hypothetical protein [Catenibacterium tridentinum]